ncbi:MAG: hypothetical protein AAF570_16415 [Bacteroidota bacterium]
MRRLRLGLEIAALAVLALVTVMQVRQIEFDLDGARAVEDLRLRDFVISHDLEFVKSELIQMQKDRWAERVYRSNDLKTFTLVLTLATVVLTIAVVRDFRRRKT